MMTDPIADFLTRIRNAVRAGHDRVGTSCFKNKGGDLSSFKRRGLCQIV